MVPGIASSEGEISTTPIKPLARSLVSPVLRGWAGQRTSEKRIRDSRNAMAWVADV